MAEVTVRTFRNVRSRPYNLVTKPDADLLYFEVVKPAWQLRIWPSFVFGWYYLKHQSSRKERKQTTFAILT